MKKLFFLLITATLLLAGCGTGSHTVVSGKPDDAGLVFMDDSSYKIDVTVDGKSYKVSTVKDVDFKKMRDIKKTAQNMIVIRPGSHDIKVRVKGKTILTQKIFVSAGDTKVINL
ncbi:MAG: hypothetical protein IKS47_01460 [Bacteroidales bacterium]|nr:hypothetical protein [Bacteroidales bacterium]